MRTIMKKIYIIIALVCILACTGCADKNSDKNNVSSAITEQETTVEVTTQAETDITVPTELSAEIPAEAVTKRTEIDFYNDKFEHKSLDYLDEHGNSLLLITTNEDSSEETIVRNSRYEYDSDGNKTYYYQSGDAEAVKQADSTEFDRIFKEFDEATPVYFSVVEK